MEKDILSNFFGKLMPMFPPRTEAFLKSATREDLNRVNFRYIFTVNGMAYNGLMPAHTHMSDAELAAVANYVLTEWGNEDQLPSDYQPYTAEDATAVRAKALSMTDVHDARVAAGLD